MCSNLRYLSKLKAHKKSLSKACQTKFQFEFIEHTKVFALLTLMPTTTRTAWESNLLYCPRQRDRKALTIRPRTRMPIRKNEKYIDSRSNFVTIGRNIMNEL